MNLTIHRGADQIGGSCVEVESRGQRLLIDFGLPLDAEGDPKKYLPDISGLDGNDSSLLGILISHPHQDHWGLLKNISPAVKIGMGIDAHRILNAAAPFIRDWPELPSPAWGFESKKPLVIGPFTVTPYLVDHSAYDAYSLLIEADGKRIFYSGDFRAHGRKSFLFEEMLKNPPKDIDALLLEGTCIGRLNDGGSFPTEQDIESQFVNAFTETKGLALVQCSAQNIDRVVTIFRACKRTGRTLVIDLYAATVLEATGRDSIPQSDWPNIALFIPQRQREFIKEHKWFDLLKTHSKHRIFIEHIQDAPEKATILFRSLHCWNLGQASCLEDALYIYSQWGGYWETDSFKSVRNWLKRHHIPKCDIHTSGHASPADLQKFATALNPKKIIPIHSFEPGRYKELFENVEAHPDGEMWEV